MVRPPPPSPLRQLGSSKSFLVVVNPQVFRRWWCMIWLVHSLEFAFLVATTRLYYWALHDPYASYYFLAYYAMDLQLKDLAVITWAFALVASLHGLALVLLLTSSWRERRLAFGNDTCSTSSLATKASTPRHDPSRCHTNWSMLIRLRQTVAVHRASKFFQQFFFVNGKYFDDCFLVQECLEVIVQVYQAHQMSVLLATRWINNVFVGMIVLNSMSTPLIHYMLPDAQLSRRRLLELSTSLALNLVNSVMIPLIIIAKYIRAYDPSIHYFSGEICFDDIWYAKSIRENRLLLVTSLFDLWSTLWPHISVFNHLILSKSILRRHDRTVPIAKATIVMAVAPESMCLPKEQLIQVAKPHRARLFFRKVTYNLLWISGLVVLGIHIAAQSVPDVVGCGLLATPWVSGSKRSCVVMNVNCYRYGIDGREAEIQSILQLLNPQTMLTLIITHCPALELPQEIQKFTQLDGLEIYNSTIAAWSASSCICEENFPVLSYVYLVRSNMSTIPPGMMQYPLAPSVTEVFIYQTNLTTLPMALSEQWSNVQSLSLELNPFEDIPPVLYAMSTQYAYLTNSSLANTPLDSPLFVDQTWCDLILSGTKLKALPDTINAARLDSLFRLQLEYTQVQSVPEVYRRWFLTKQAQGLEVEHSLFGSPFCDQVPQLVDNLTETETEEVKKYHRQVCAQDDGSVRVLPH